MTKTLRTWLIYHSRGKCDVGVPNTKRFLLLIVEFESGTASLTVDASKPTFYFKAKLEVGKVMSNKC